MLLSNVYIEGYILYNFQKYIVFLSLKIDFVLANSAKPDEKSCSAAFHLRIHCLKRINKCQSNTTYTFVQLTILT